MQPLERIDCLLYYLNSCCRGPSFCTWKRLNPPGGQLHSSVIYWGLIDLVATWWSIILEGQAKNKKNGKWSCVNNKRCNCRPVYLCMQKWTTFAGAWMCALVWAFQILLFASYSESVISLQSSVLGSLTVMWGTQAFSEQLSFFWFSLFAYDSKFRLGAY